MESPFAAESSTFSDDELSVELARAFGRFGPRFVAWMKSGIRDDGVSLGRLRLLRALDQEGPQIMASLRRTLDVTARNVTQLVDGLEAEGLVTREPHPTDRRASVIALTSRGRDRCHDAFTAHIERTSTLFEQLDCADQKALLKIMRQLTDHLDERPSPTARGESVGEGPPSSSRPPAEAGPLTS